VDYVFEPHFDVFFLKNKEFAAAGRSHYCRFPHKAVITDAHDVAPADGAPAVAQEWGALACPSAPTSTSKRWALVTI
jgi:hypothetical protein